MTILPRDIDALVEIFESSQWDEMHLQMDGVELFLSTNPCARMPGAAAPLTAPPPIAAAAPASGALASSTQVSHSDVAPSTASVPSHWMPITAPNLGTFYRAPKPGAPAFVEIGQAVEASSEICLIEVMKLFTTLKAGVKGTVKQICVKDAVMVEHGDVLFYIEPS